MTVFPLALLALLLSIYGINEYAYKLFIYFITVCDDHDFKDEKLFYRFRKDDGSYEEPPDTLLLAKGQRIYSR